MTMHQTDSDAEMKDTLSATSRDPERFESSSLCNSGYTTPDSADEAWKQRSDALASTESDLDDLFEGSPDSGIFETPRRNNLPKVVPWIKHDGPRPEKIHEDVMDAGESTGRDVVSMASGALGKDDPTFNKSKAGRKLHEEVLIPDMANADTQKFEPRLHCPSTATHFLTERIMPRNLDDMRSKDIDPDYMTQMSTHLAKLNGDDCTPSWDASVEYSPSASSESVSEDEDERYTTPLDDGVMKRSSIRRASSYVTQNMQANTSSVDPTRQQTRDRAESRVELKSEARTRSSNDGSLQAVALQPRPHLPEVSPTEPQAYHPSIIPRSPQLEHSRPSPLSGQIELGSDGKRNISNPSNTIPRPISSPRHSNCTSNGTRITWFLNGAPAAILRNDYSSNIIGDSEQGSNNTASPGTDEKNRCYRPQESVATTGIEGIEWISLLIELDTNEDPPFSVKVTLPERFLQSLNEYLVYKHDLGQPSFEPCLGASTPPSLYRPSLSTDSRERRAQEFLQWAPEISNLPKVLDRRPSEVLYSKHVPGFPEVGVNNAQSQSAHRELSLESPDGIQSTICQAKRDMRKNTTRRHKTPGVTALTRKRAVSVTSETRRVTAGPSNPPAAGVQGNAKVTKPRRSRSARSVSRKATPMKSMTSNARDVPDVPSLPTNLALAQIRAEEPCDFKSVITGVLETDFLQQNNDTATDPHAPHSNAPGYQLHVPKTRNRAKNSGPGTPTKCSPRPRKISTATLPAQELETTDTATWLPNCQPSLHHPPLSQQIGSAPTFTTPPRRRRPPQPRSATPGKIQKQRTPKKPRTPACVATATQQLVQLLEASTDTATDKSTNNATATITNTPTTTIQPRKRTGSPPPPFLSRQQSHPRKATPFPTGKKKGPVRVVPNEDEGIPPLPVPVLTMPRPEGRAEDVDPAATPPNRDESRLTPQSTEREIGGKTDGVVGRTMRRSPRLSGTRPEAGL